MRETDLDELFAEFERRTAPTFRPPGLSAAGRRVRERRVRRRGLLAGVAALLLAGPAGAYALAGRDSDGNPPTPAPSPTASPPDDRPVQRKVTVPGVRGELRQLKFVDARHGWALFDTCDSEDVGSTDCQRDLARTADGGATWQRKALPGVVNEPTTPGGLGLLPVDDQQLTVATGNRYLVTTDGGASFTEHSVDAPPRVTRLAFASRDGYLLRCPDDDGLSRSLCNRRQLVRVDGVAVPAQPPLDLRTNADKWLIEGGDDRLWVAVRNGDRMTVAVSDDRAVTWRTLPTVAGAAGLLVSPDGTDAWLVSVDPESGSSSASARRVWALTGNRWQEQPGLPDDTFAAAAANDGVLALTGVHGGGGYWADGRYVDEPALGGRQRDGGEAFIVRVLPDDTIVMDYPTGTFLGTGSGVDRSWTWVS
ncbi:WD40/YVTN/BNR-like repeat-containing protein [Micromonospora sp. NPDC051006]|uniref:WD40/YVTN/BNR-like repeat-containing protein n=1 Tax=Micromonospora sp. NPDC051006 TaxID=3364283 RepID=UPI00379CC1B4